MSYVYFAKIDTETGECHGFSTFASLDHALLHYEGTFPDFLVEITPQERDLLRERNGETNEKTYKIDTTLGRKTLSERPNRAMPVETEGIGGKEIIGYETKPVGIVIERELSPEKGKIGKE